MRRSAQNASKNINARRQRPTTGSRLTFGQFGTILGVSMALLLLGVTFMGDYFRVPKVSLSVFPDVISPNQDQAQDSTNINYSLSENADVSVVIFNENGVRVKTLHSQSKQPAGQYIATWNGIDDTGALAADGQYTIEVRAKGVSRSSTAHEMVIIDTKAPLLQLTNLEDVSKVADPALTIEGITEAGATVYQAGNAQAIPVDAQGYFKLERQLSEGSNILDIYASDQAGNTAHVSHNVMLITRPPELTVFSPANDQWLNERVMNVTGIAPNAAEVMINDQSAIVEDDGTFKREIILREGDNNIRIEVTDEVGNKTVTEKLIHLKTNAPGLDLNLADGTVLQQSKMQLTGRTDPGSIVRVNNKLVSVSPMGEFQTMLNFNNGKNIIKVETRDIAGNVMQVSREVTFESPTSQSETTQFFNHLPPISKLATPLLILVPGLLLFGYIFTRPISLLLTADTETFTPGLPEEGQTVTLRLNTSKSARVSVQVMNQFGQPVATVSPRRQRSAGAHTIVWDGYDEWGNVLSPGEYTLQATASTPSGVVRSAIPIVLRQDPLVYAQYGRNHARQSPVALSGRR